jgi:hypothetical protein
MPVVSSDDRPEVASPAQAQIASVAALPSKQAGWHFPLGLNPKKTQNEKDSL